MDMNHAEESPDRLGFHIFGSLDLPFTFKHSALDVIGSKYEAPNKSGGATKENPVAFRGCVFIQDYSSAIAAAYQASELSWSEGVLALWPDASMELGPDSNSPAGYAVAAIQGSRWVGRLGHSFETAVLQAELCAISVAIDMAIDEIKKLQSQGRLLGVTGPTVKIFSDSQGALKLISALPNPPRHRKNVHTARRRQVLCIIAQQSHELDRLGGYLMLYWVPRGRVSGNKIADALAKSARRRYKFSVRRMVGIAERTLSRIEVDEGEREHTQLSWALMSPSVPLSPSTVASPVASLVASPIASPAMPKTEA